MGTSSSSRRFTAASTHTSWRGSHASGSSPKRALAAPFAGFGDFEAFPEFHQKAAVYCARLATYHPLPDGNKRTAYDVMREFIDRNEHTFTHPEGGLAATAQTIEDLAATALSEADFIAWVAARLT